MTTIYPRCIDSQWAGDRCNCLLDFVVDPPTRLREAMPPMQSIYDLNASPAAAHDAQ